ncbi:MAG: alpha/beta hydrolase [Bryobacteraceae bacterium]|nr:alpha/beta hydrolase [Bryobacteraceae bacterium]
MVTAVVLLPGAGGHAGTLARHIPYFEPEWQTLAISYPPVPTLGELCREIASRMDEAGVGIAHVIGGSYGGMVAQAFAEWYPQRVGKLVLSHTGGPDPGRGAKMRTAARWMNRLPLSWLKWIFGKRMGKLIPSVPEAREARLQFERILKDWTRRDIDALFARAAEFQNFGPATWQGETLLLWADDDPATPEPVRTALHQRYPQAQVYEFHGTGHAAALLKPDEYFGAIRDFLRAPSGAQRGQLAQVESSGVDRHAQRGVDVHRV